MAQVRYNEVWLIGCPSSLGSFSSATTHTFVCLVLLTFICPFCVHMCLPPFRAGWRSHMPPFGEACVCNPWSHRDPSGLVFILHYGRGAMNTLEGIAQRRPFHRVVIFLRDASGTYLLFPFPFLNGERLSQEPHDTVLFRASVHFLQMRSTRSPPSTLRFWPHFLFQTPRLRGSLLVLLGIGTLGRRVAPHSVQYTISQVCVCVCQPLFLRVLVSCIRLSNHMSTSCS